MSDYDFKPFAWHNSDYSKADFVLLGVPDESGSHAKRVGSSEGPDRIRSVSRNRDVFERGSQKALVQAQLAPADAKIHDMGNVEKNKVMYEVSEILEDKKIPVTIGGDHSITVEALKAFGEHDKKKVALVYFDAHPDIVCTTRDKYYGSVVCDLSELNKIYTTKSVEVGVRAPEAEEIKNLRTTSLMTLTPNEIQEKGIMWAYRKIKKRTKGYDIYLSIDMDVVDPAFAPGVGTPVPGGLSGNEVITLAKRVASLGICGFDVMETCPQYDMQDMTSHLAGHLIMEIINATND